LRQRERVGDRGRRAGSGIVRQHADGSVDGDDVCRTGRDERAGRGARAGTEVECGRAVDRQW
jgi:hypothetical protein